MIRKVTAAGIISTIAGSGMKAGYSGDNGPATQALLNQPTGIVVDSSGNVYFSDSGNSVVRKIDRCRHYYDLRGEWNARDIPAMAARPRARSLPSRRGFRSMRTETCLSPTATTREYAR